MSARAHANQVNVCVSVCSCAIAEQEIKREQTHTHTHACARGDENSGEFRKYIARSCDCVCVCVCVHKEKVTFLCARARLCSRRVAAFRTASERSMLSMLGVCV